MATNDRKDSRRLPEALGRDLGEGGKSSKGEPTTTNFTYQPRKTISEPALTSTSVRTTQGLIDAIKAKSVRVVLSPTPTKKNLRHAATTLSSARREFDPHGYVTAKQSTTAETQTSKTFKRSLFQEDTVGNLEPRRSYSDTEIPDQERESLGRVSHRISKKKSICALPCCSMETRSKTRLSRSTPRSRTSARTRPIVKQELEDEHLKTAISWDDSGIIDSPRRDTPAHLYGLDGSNEPASSEDEICVDTNNNDAQHRKSWFSPTVWRVISMISVMVVLVVIAHLFQPCPKNAPLFSGMKINFAEQDDREEKIDSNLRELQDKLEQLSAQVSGLRQSVVKNDTEDTPSEEEEPMTKEKLQRMLEKIMRDNMEAALDRYSADKLGIPDYALESDGGLIHVPHHSPTFNARSPRSLLSLSLWYDSVLPKTILQPDNKPGECWAFEGDKGFVVIKLSKPIIPTMFTLEHIPSSLSTNGHGRIPSAPKDFSVWGWSDKEGEDKVSLGNFQYNNEGKSIQTFKVKKPGSTVFELIELRVESNHGNPTHTCIYRFRVHGDLPQATTPPLPAEDCAENARPRDENPPKP